MRAEVRVRHQGQTTWAVPTVSAYDNERQLQMMIQEDPALLPLTADPPIVVAREFPLPFDDPFGGPATTLWIDLVGVGAGGGITVVECKLKDNADMKRTVVGQLFAYATGLWRMSFERFSGQWQLSDEGSNKNGPGRPSLLDDVGSAAARLGQTVDSVAFTRAVEENLQSGSFTLLLAVDEITPELRRIIEYLSKHTAAGIHVLALELGHATVGTTEILVPVSYGTELAAAKDAGFTGVPIAPDEASFTALLMEKEGRDAVSIYRSVLDWAIRQGLSVWYGSGTKTGSANIAVLDPETGRQTLLACASEGGLWITLRHTSASPFDASDKQHELVARLTASGVKIPKPDQTSVLVRYQSLADPGALASLLGVLGWVLQEMEVARPPHSI